MKYLKRLKSSNIYFADNDLKKVGGVTDGVKCISRNEVETMADRSIILVSPYRNTDLYDDLRRNFPYVIPDIVLEILAHWPQANGFDKIYNLGHYYSLYPNMVELEQRKDILYSVNKEIKDIDFNVDKQYIVLEKMKELLPSIPQWIDGSQYVNSMYRYRTDVQAFCLPDATCLHLMLRILQPKRLIEVGSGWSSAVTLDTNEFYLNKELKISFIEPFPVTLNCIKKDQDYYETKECGLQEVELSYFEQLEKGDVLFIDSTHVSKMGSDVNYLLFEILPRLKRGVYIHFHDIFYPFEYPYEWIEKEGYIWNELYMLRCFLMNNKNYEILFFFDYLTKIHSDKVEECLQMRDVSGGSFWLVKV